VADNNDHEELREYARTAVGREIGLSEAQSKRIVGSTLAEMRHDAKQMARELGLEVDDEDDDASGAQRDEHGRFAKSGGRDMNRLIRAASGR
jgi:hypothetical protein